MHKSCRFQLLHPFATLTLGQPCTQPTGQLATLSNGTKFGLYVAVIFLITVVCSAPSRVTAWYSTFGALWNLVALASFSAAVYAAAPTHQSVAYVFTDFEINSDLTGITSPVWSFMVACGMGLSTIIMYDSGTLNDALCLT